MLDITSGAVTRIIDRPETLAVRTDAGVVAAVSGLGDGTLTVVDAEGTRTEGAVGGLPCHLAFSPDGRWIVTADYGSGSLSLIDRAAAERRARARDGVAAPTRTVTLAGHGSGVDPERQTQPRPHHVLWIGSTLLVTDLGSDVVRVLEPTPDGGLRERAHCATPPGSGPRHALVVRDPGHASPLLVVSAELSAELLVAPVEDVLAGTASWSRAATSGHPASGRTYPSEIVAWGDGIAVGNRGAGTIGVFEIETGIPRRVAEHGAGGSWPLHIVVDDEGDLLVAQTEDDAIVRLRPDGRLDTIARVAAPTWIELPAR